MLKSVLAGAAALAIAGTSLVYAQQQAQPQQQNTRETSQRWRPSADDISALGDARIAALRAGLKLTPEQEKHWPAVEAALRDLAKQRSERFTARASADRPRDRDFVERLRLRADAMSQRGASLKKFADASAPLYASLDDGQKRRFAMLARIGGRDGHRGFRGGFMHRGQGGPERGPQQQ